MDEFLIIWLMSAQKWVALLPDNMVLDRGFQELSVARNAALEHLNSVEEDFSIEDSTRIYSRYIRMPRI